MKFECLKERIQSAVNKAEKAVGRNMSLPILSCMLFECRKNSLKIKATNLDIGVEIDVPIRGLSDGVAAISSSVINGFISNVLNDGSLKFEQKDGSLLVQSSNSSAVLKTLPIEDFPVIPKPNSEKSIRIAAKNLINGLKSVWYSAAVSGIKPELSSICLFGGDGVLTFVATDSFRLAEKKIKAKDVKDFNHTLLPVKNVGEIIRIFDDIEADLDVGVSNNQLTISSGSIYLTSRLIDATFPDYNRIIPKEFDTEATLLKEDLAQALKQINIFSDNFHQVNVKINPSKKVFELKAGGGQTGEVVNKLSAAISGGEIDISFNFRYISDSLQSINTDSITLSFAGAHKPMVITGVNDQSFTYLVMPMNR